MRDTLTTASLKNLSNNTFELANVAIGIMRNYIRKGHQISVDELLDLIRKKGLEELLKEAQLMEALEHHHDR